MRLVILGGGGFRVPLIHEAILSGAVAVDIDELVLHDASPQRLAEVESILAEQAATRPAGTAAPRVVATTDLSAALTGADFVFSAIRVGGAAGRVRDERVALELGLLGQETVGPGGLAYALRTIPVMHAIATAIAEAAPNAWTINFTNPAGIVTQAMQRVLGDRVVGICDTPVGLVRRVGRVLGVDPADSGRVAFDYVGLNHMGWLRAFVVDGVDRLPGLLADDPALDGIEEARVVGRDWVRQLGVLPNEYLYYYWHTAEAIRGIRDATQTRGEQLLELQARYEARLRDGYPPLATWREALGHREATYMAEARDEARRDEDLAGGGYQEVALRLMRSLAGGGPERLILDVANRRRGGRLIPELPEGVVVEVACEVDSTGVRPLPVAPLTLRQLGDMARLRASEEAIMEAALTGSAARAWEGFATHPLVSSPTLGAELLRRYRRAHREIDALLGPSLS